ncbi:hypothetical protein C0995_014500 [Termitomyces sp. Mi166|nr:hypothetical protein C0995_014500 [Termitomyces sp. Mi166\
MPGKHVRFLDIPSMPQSNYSSSISPPILDQPSFPHDSKLVPPVRSLIRINPKLSVHERLIHYDLRLPPENALVHPKLGRFVNDQVTEPALSSMTIICEVLPRWSITVVESQLGYGVTIMDVLHAIYRSLRTSVSEADFVQLSPDMQRRVSDAFQRRYRSITDEKVHATEKSKGLKLVDVLGEKKMFAGLRSTLQGQKKWIVIATK